MITVAGYVGITMLGKNRVIEVIQVDVVGSEIEEENYKLKLNIFIISSGYRWNCVIVKRVSERK